ncbi:MULTISPECIES: hypothetical protein [Spirosoma]|uniref:DUF3244 domain-containing protein n=1 Tax=Spirosoma liriopis TaxID=2937440 RepID=A0ABT0HE22_9BACT|nr:MULTISPECIES: hypothetical protein [Spirosoma]MCK8490408.1 hypothetical protein [Spirosoma liriopis]UHG89780.1 hypothetical protein LQ777_16180 [Spirosoma oryzicola]
MLLPMLHKLALSALISASTLSNPTTPKAFDASAFVTIDNHIRVSVVKTADTAIEVLLRNAENEVVYQQYIGRKDEKFALKLNVDQLTDGKYELEVKSNGTSFRKQLNLSTQPVRETSRVVAMH